MVLVQEFLHALLLGIGHTSGLVDALLLHKLPGDGVGRIGYSLTLLAHHSRKILLRFGSFLALIHKQLLKSLNVAGDLNIYLKTLRQILGNLGVGVKDGF